MLAAPSAICVNPNNAATSATARKIKDQRNIVYRFYPGTFPEGLIRQWEIHAEA
jgi:hypothetical protein